MNRELTTTEIRLNNIRLFARHGVMGQEQLTGGDFTVTIAVGYDFSRAMETDDVDDTLNYAELFRIVKEQMDIPSRLLEHVAGRIATEVFNQWPDIQYVSIQITKVNPPMGADCDGATVSLTLRHP